uniref:SET and MYND domain-containing protein 4 n=1 Tax=Lygus hesperus TaxID=30085 RepID=A0A0A9Y9W7_LYGHE
MGNMRNLKLEDIVKDVTRFVAQSGMYYEAFNPTVQGIGEIYDVLEVTGLLPEVTTKTSKSDASSERLRASGNQAFVSDKNDMEALHFYTKAIGSAIPNGKVMALAYANRSAVTFALGEYGDSIKDIDRALSGNYPEHLKYKLVERRGKCYSALSQYDKALDDFRDFKALISKSNLGKEKIDLLNSQIDKLMKECTETSNTSPITNSEFPRLSHDPSPYIQCASSAVDIKFSPQMGRHVVAANDIFPGDVLAIEKPFASVLLPPSYDFFCDFCKKRCHSSVPCLYCCDIVFCNEVCREKSWSSHHSIECDLLPSLIAMGCDKMELLSIRILLIATECGKRFQKLIDSYFAESSRASPELKGFVDSKYLSDDYCSTHYLETNCDSRSSEDIFRRGTISACIIHVLKESTDFFKFCDFSVDVPDDLYRKFTVDSDLSLAHVVAGDLILRYLMSAPCNAHEIAEMRVWPTRNDLETESTEIGGAIYPFHSLINHSCDPNVVRHAFDGDIVVLSSIQK